VCSSDLLFAALVLYWRERRRFDPSVFEYLILSVVFMMVSEISFTLYEELFSAWNAVGHILKVFSFFYLYRAVLQTAIHRPHVLLYRSLKRREEQLRDVNAELEEYAHTVAHDFKGPLTSIGLSAEMMTRTLSRRPLGDRDLELLERLAKQVSDGARSSAQFVSEVLALAEAGQKPQVLGAVPVGEVIEKILSERAGVLATRKITVHWDKGRLGSVFGSRVQIYQLFLNLIDNAIKHASAASPEIHIRYREGSKPGEHHYEVQDNGPGIDPEIIDKIFLPFFKANSTGHGLGLATVQKIARAYGGAVSVTNRDGACFEVILHDFSA
ncbi:MAG: ATP-binding protein, partial [Oligoflexia bacterium]|nr:ATP-binding protein [Oligoflexia bacterium]